MGLLLIGRSIISSGVLLRAESVITNSKGFTLADSFEKGLRWGLDSTTI